MSRNQSDLCLGLSPARPHTKGACLDTSVARFELQLPPLTWRQGDSFPRVTRSIKSSETYKNREDKAWHTIDIQRALPLGTDLADLFKQQPHY